MSIATFPIRPPFHALPSCAVADQGLTGSTHPSSCARTQQIEGQTNTLPPCNPHTPGHHPVLFGDPPRSVGLSVGLHLVCGACALASRTCKPYPPTAARPKRIRLSGLRWPHLQRWVGWVRAVIGSTPPCLRAAAPPSTTHNPPTRARRPSRAYPFFSPSFLPTLATLPACLYRLLSVSRHAARVCLGEPVVILLISPLPVSPTGLLTVIATTHLRQWPGPYHLQSLLQSGRAVAISSD